MPPSNTKGDIVLRLLDGRSEQRQIVLDGGRARPPFAVGRRGAWRIDGGHVARAHVMLAFNGSVLYVCAIGGQKALLDGTPLDGRWMEVSLPSVLRFGSARLGIGRRAGPEEVTQLPRREEEATCYDEARLQAALALSTQDEEVTCIAEVEVPDAARRPLVEAAPPRPVRRPTIVCAVAKPPPPPPILQSLPESARTWAAPAVGSEQGADGARDDVASSLPPTVPSEDLVSPAGDSLDGIARLAATGETSARSSAEEAACPAPRSRMGGVVHAWSGASLPKRAIALIMIPTVIVAVFTMRPTGAARGSSRQAPAITKVAVPPAATATSSGMPTPRAPPVPPAPAAGLHDTRTAERRALDTATAGDGSATEQYEALAAAHPENVAFREAVRILRARALTPR
jgi:hypothetical protein